MKMSEFKSLNADVAAHVDVLIQHSENYYAVCKKVAASADDEPGRFAMMLARQAIGNELVSRLYRLIKDDADGNNFPLLMAYLRDEKLMLELMSGFNYDGRKTIEELRNHRDSALGLFDDVRSSLRFERVTVYRARYVAHRVPQPRALKKYGSEADVHSLSAADLRWLSDNLSLVLTKTAYMIDRSDFPADDIGHMAEDEANALWGLPEPKQRHFLADVIGSSDE